MVYRRLLYSGFNFGRHCGVITFLSLVIYIHSVSTSAIISDAPQNATDSFTNNTTTQNDGITNMRTSNQVHNSIEISKKSVGINPFEKNSEIKSGPPLALPHSIFVIDTFSQKKIEHKLSKEATELLRWLDIDLGPAKLLNRLKRLRKQTLNSARREQIHELLKKDFLSNSISFKSKQAENETRQTQEKKKMSNTDGINNSSDSHQEKLTQKSLLEVNNSAGSLDPSVSLPRFRRQVDEAEELPHWPGAPQGPLRQHLKPHVVKQKILSMMLQALYSAQERLAPMGSIVTKYEHLTPYRMAFIFLKLDQLVYESHSIFIYLNRLASDPLMTLTRRLQLYGHLVRRNVDITYLVDYINERVPRDQATRIRQAVIRFEQEKIMKQHLLFGKTTTELLQRPHS